MTSILFALLVLESIWLSITFKVMLFAGIAFFLFKIVERVYSINFKKPLFNHFYIILRELSENEKTLLGNNFPFYNKLDSRYKRYFEHRVATFIQSTNFIGREGLVINDEIKVLIAGTAIKLTFGFKYFNIDLVEHIIVYPNEFYSNINKVFHKGEFNPKMKTLVFSWEDFREGIEIGNDNLNLGIHEFAHAIHINSKKSNKVDALLFNQSFIELTELLSSDKSLRQDLIESNYFRSYAFTNQFEFLAVILENFIETPNDFKSSFPTLYLKTKQMLNFHFVGY